MITDRPCCDCPLKSVQIGDLVSVTDPDTGTPGNVPFPVVAIGDEQSDKHGWVLVAAPLSPKQQQRRVWIPFGRYVVVAKRGLTP